MKLKLKLGTRKSLLAWAQSSWIAREVERLNPGTEVELIGIETRGDKIQNIPLQKVEGKDFFVAELDQALQAGAVDLTVHSMKDLSLSRPPDLICAAIPTRENPRDVILFGPNALDRLKAKKKLKIGTSSPRRLENIPSFLERALPQIGGRPSLAWEEIRGNVNTRLGRVHEAESSERYLDGVVLAFAGLIRLWADSRGREELKKLLQGVRWMVLPLKECPAAPAQGALAVECRKADQEVQRVLSLLHSPETADQAARERRLLEQWGGGCHQRFGATALHNKELGSVLYVRGVKQDGVFVEEFQWTQPESPREMGTQSWDGSRWRSVSSGGSEGTNVEGACPPGNQAVFVAHSRAVHGALPEQLGDKRIWTSGVASWFHLAEKGLWVEGCAEGFGFKSMTSTSKEGVLQLPPHPEWVVLTHAQALEEWKELGIQAVPTYKINLKYGIEAKTALQSATHVFWSSGSQYDELKEGMLSRAHHACGPGKTAERLREAGVRPVVFPSVEEWRKWLRISN